jgi:hypothetical protein
MFSEIPDDEIAAAIDVCAAELLWEAGITEPPVDTLAVADGLGLTIIRNDGLPYRGRFARLASHLGSDDKGHGTIVVAPAERSEREQWAVAHEIGESAAYRVFDRLGLAFDETLPTAREMVANRLANSLLLPRRWFVVDGRELDWDLMALKDCYSTASHELIARRMLDMRPPIVVTVCDHGRIHWRRSNSASQPPSLLPDEKRVWEESHLTGLQTSIAPDPESGLASIRCWPIHEPSWKREIIRSEIAEV